MAVTGCGGQRPGAVLARRLRRAGRGAARRRRAGRSARESRHLDVVRCGRDGAGERARRRTRRRGARRVPGWRWPGETSPRPLDGSGAAGLAVEDEPVYPREPEYRVLARLLLAEHKPAAALELLERWRALAVAQGRAASMLRLRVLDALAHEAAGDPAARADRTGRGARSCRAGGLPAGVPRRGRADRGATAGAAGRSAPRAARRGFRPARVPCPPSAAFDLHGMPVLPPVRRGVVAAPGMVQPLSTREHEVLTLLAAGHPNREIADELFITVDTVKRHVSHVLTSSGWQPYPGRGQGARCRAARLRPPSHESGSRRGGVPDTQMPAG